MTECREWNGICLVSDGGPFPDGSVPAAHPFAPLVIAVRRDGLASRGAWRIGSLAELNREEGPEWLLPCVPDGREAGELAGTVRENGALVVNTFFPGSWERIRSIRNRKRDGLKLTLVGLGDVGGTVLTALKLLGEEIREISVFDPNAALCARYEMELNQVLPARDGQKLPLVTVCPEEKLFDTDYFLFTASRGVPGLNSGVSDVRMAQFEANRELIRAYARRARESRFQGVFCQISDPVDLLCREVFLESNRDASGRLDFQGLRPEQVQGFGLGVMAARAAYCAGRLGLDPASVRVYGPHGQGLVVASAPDAGYSPERSAELTEGTVSANLKVRELGFKPYIAPGISSAAVSILRMIRGEWHYGAVPLGGVYFGCVSRETEQGTELFREELHPELFRRIRDAYDGLRRYL